MTIILQFVHILSSIIYVTCQYMYMSCKLHVNNCLIKLEKSFSYMSYGSLWLFTPLILNTWEKEEKYKMPENKMDFLNFVTFFRTGAFFTIKFPYNRNVNCNFNKWSKLNSWTNYPNTFGLSSFFSPLPNSSVSLYKYCSSPPNFQGKVVHSRVPSKVWISVYYFQIKCKKSFALLDICIYYGFR